jgi:SAM-dependent methyltransferase
MVCLEPSQAACQLARQACAPYPDVEIVGTTFEGWELESKQFDAVLAATSFHWVAPEIACRKAAAALRDLGSLILLWNVIPQPQFDVYQLLHETYQTLAPSITPHADANTQVENVKIFEQTVSDSGLFRGIESAQIECQETYSIDDYLALLSTLSPYIHLESQKRQELFDISRKVLMQYFGGSIQTSYISALFVAKKSASITT